MKKITRVLLLVLLVFLIMPGKIDAKEKIDIYFFYSDTCPHCKDQEKYMETLKKSYDIEVHEYETSSDQNSKLLSKAKKAFGIEDSYVPFTIIGTRHFSGYNENTGEQIRKTLEFYQKNEINNIGDKIINQDYDLEPEDFVIDDINYNSYIIPIIGEVNPRTVSLPLLAVVIGTVDGFNPCAMWVLLFLIGMLIGMKDKKKMWVLGLTFLVTSALIYALMMVSWLQISVSMMQIQFVQIAIALFAVGAGLFNLNKFRKARKSDVGCEVVSSEKRTKTLDKIKKITAEQNIFIAMVGIALLAVSVNIVELACSAGLPLMFTQILAVNNLSFGAYSLYIFLYILFFLIDDLIVFAIAVKTFERVGMSNKYSKYSTLIGGIIMVLIGLLLIFAPDILMFA